MRGDASICRLGLRDAVEYRRLMLEAYDAHPEAFTSTASERAALPMAWWESRLDEDPLAREVVFGALERDRIVGAAGLSFETREKAKHKATLFGMYVPAECRGRGIGRALVVSALDHARSRADVMLVQLTVTEGNASAQTLYRKCGFVQFGLEPLAVAVGPMFVSKVHMWCKLR